MSDADHFDGRSKPTSTSKILNKISDKPSYAEALLNPNSLERKKKDSEQFFNEICYVVRMEELKINREVVLYLQKTEELAYAEMDSYLYSLSKTSLDAINLNLENERLLISKAQLQRISEFYERINKALERIAYMLKEIDGFIAKQREMISKLETKLVEVKEKFCEAWNEVFDLTKIRDKFEDITMYFSTEKHHLSLKAHHHGGYITFDASMYLQLAQAVEMEIKNGGSLLNLNEIIEDKAAKLIQNKLETELSFLQTRDRNEYIREIMEKTGTKQAVSQIKNKMVKVAAENPNVVQYIRDAARCEIELTEMKAIVAIQENKRNHLLAYGFELKNIQDVSSDLASSPMQQMDDLLMDKNMDALEMLTNNLSNEFDLINGKLDEKVMQCNFMIACGDDAVSSLGMITTMADECQQNFNTLKEIKDGLPELTALTSETFENMFSSVMEAMKTEKELAKMSEISKNEGPSSPSLK